MKYFLTTLLLAGLAVCSFGQEIPWDVNGRGLSFEPDYSFKGSSLTAWHPLGAAAWQARDGEITVNANGGTALLASDKSFQDVAVHLIVKAAPGSEAGVLVRMEKTGDGYKALLVSIKDNAATTYRVTLDAQGKELSREQLRGAGNIIRIAPKPPAASAGGTAAGGRRGGAGGGRPAGPTDLPIPRASSAIVAGDWNQFEVIVDFNIIRKFINDGGDFQGGATDDLAEKGGQGYGPIALYASGTGEVQFKDIKYKDVHVLFTPKEASSSRFKPQRINDMFYSFSAAAADFNKDGYTDIVSGPYIYFGPDYTHYQEIFFAQTYNPSREFALINCQYTFDVNGDGWPDVIVGAAGHPRVYINPKGESRRWDEYDALNLNTDEVTTFKDIDGDGKPELVFSSGGTVYYSKINPEGANKPWILHAVSAKGYGLGHGIGVGDINGDGRIDIINPNGWWEQPAKGLDTGVWKYHPEVFSRYGHWSGAVGGSIMAVYDVNGDGLNDVVTALNAHGFGLGWFEQKRDKSGKITFVKHMIMDDFSTKNAGDVTFSELHGTNFADVNGDGIPDFIAGKRYWSHLDSYFDPYPYCPGVVYAYITVRDKKAPGGAKFVPELVHNRSGAGSDITVADLNKDGKMDIITATDRGTYIFWNQTKGTGKAKAKTAATVHK
ncbi:FG-GAP-like repeat-containing protein [Mucilaginibacter sp.]|uniref:FG-GAP-like repeat-containing protein n=1 Tax=Mucilaginibacter sp. TaxID=1882438 RepID=UPI002632DEED|nr:FG-GAP-like repeat-containing protein [Mucilaginibacter sp.]MDB4925348.1 repeat protein [Mucilaginibacter sp.]